MAYLGAATTEEVRSAMSAGPVVALVPVGSTEPHGPHLPLATDTLISEAVAARACERLVEKGLRAVVGASIAYGVTEFSQGFAGAISVEADALVTWVRAVVMGYLNAKFDHVCVVNNHLEPAHDEAIRKALLGFPEGRVSYACPLTRRWARTLSDEFKSGACHAGRYETSLVLATDREAVRTEIATTLSPLTISLSEAIREGAHTFAQVGMTQAYTGAPAEASVEEGRTLLEKLATCAVTEIEEAMKRMKEARNPE